MSTYHVALPNGQGFKVTVDPAALGRFPEGPDELVFDHVKSLVSVMVEKALLPEVAPIISSKFIQRDESGAIVGMNEMTPPTPAEMATEAGDDVAARFVAEFEAAQ